MSALIDKGDLLGAKSRSTTSKHYGTTRKVPLKTRAAADWHIIDKAIDRAQEALRAATTDPANCKQTITDLLSLMDSIGKS